MASSVIKKQTHSVTLAVSHVNSRIIEMIINDLDSTSKMHRALQQSDCMYQQAKNTICAVVEPHSRQFVDYRTYVVIFVLPQ